MDNWKDIVKKCSRYKDFTIAETPVKFMEMFAGQDIPCVQLHSIQVYSDGKGQDIIGFCGSFSWKNNQIIPLDGDSYAKNMLVYGQSWFFDDNHNKCLDILVGEEW